MNIFSRERKDARLEWPETTPIDKTDPYWEFNNNLSLNGVQYKKEEVAPAKWQWVVNEWAEDRRAKRAKEKSDLYWALRSRVLTDEEMLHVATMGIDLVIQLGVPYLELDKQRELNDALLQQVRLRAIAGKS